MLNQTTSFIEVTSTSFTCSGKENSAWGSKPHMEVHVQLEKSTRAIDTGVVPLSYWERRGCQNSNSDLEYDNGHGFCVICILLT